MAPLDLTKTELTPQEIEDIRTEVARFEMLYHEHCGALSALQRANLTRAYQNLVDLGIGLECPANALMAWGVHTGLTNDMLEDWRFIERLLLAYDGGHKDLDAYIRELYSRFFNVDNAQALRFVDTKAFKDELEYCGWCFTPSLDGTIFFAFND